MLPNILQVATLLRKQRLVLSAADKILTTLGPDKGRVFQPENGLVIASESVVAHDRYRWTGSWKIGTRYPPRKRRASKIPTMWLA